MDIQLLSSYGGLVVTRKHPSLPLLIHNYTARCQHERAWDKVTVMCRGLITDLSGNVVARPFPKFFNLGEHGQFGLPEVDWNQGFCVTEKMDGSLGIAYPTDDGWAIATRGSFDSPQAKRGTAMLQSLNVGILDKRKTYLFEIIYPENRIVVSYGERAELVLLDVIDNDTGAGLFRSLLEIVAGFLGCPLVKEHRLSMDDILLGVTGDGEGEGEGEGVVVRFDSGLRVKIKTDSGLHAIVSRLNTRVIWEDLWWYGRYVVEPGLPPEIENWIHGVLDRFNRAFASLESRAIAEYREACRVCVSRKEFAAVFGKSDLRRVLFLMLDDSAWDRAIWDMLKPTTAEWYSGYGERS